MRFLRRDRARTDLAPAVVFAMAFTAGCARGPRTEPNATTLKEGQPPPAHCDAAGLRQRAEAILSGASGACRTVEDCECYAGSALNTCGGVTDRATADQLNALAGEASNQGCEPGVQCAARVCVPACDHGRCR